MRYSPYIILITVLYCLNLLSAGITCAQSSDNRNSYDSSSQYVLNILTGKAWERDKTDEEDFIENIEFGQGWLYFKGKYSGIIRKDINQIDIKNNRYINFNFVNSDFEKINKSDYGSNVYSINIKLINSDGEIVVEKYIEFPSDIEENLVSVNLREFSHFINTNTIINKFIISNPTYPGKWGFKEITITQKPAGSLLRYDGYGYAPEESEGTSLIPQPFISKNVIDQYNNLIMEGDIHPREGTVYDDDGGIISLFGYEMPVSSGGWLDIVIPDDLVINIKENPIMSLDVKTEADLFNFNIMARNTDGELIIGGNNDNKALVEIQNTKKEWENYKINLGEKISNKISNTKIKSIRFYDLEVKTKGEKIKNYYEIKLSGLHFEK
ncbi:MAG: hypothetical protein PHX78_03250 [bacterium]|nr:hypothetical protein [bacterium]